MPYVNPDTREYIDYGGNPSTAGELNYKLFTTILKYLNTQGKCYETMNEIMGVLNCVQHEFYRRCMSPYEDSKIKAYGDIQELNAK